MPPTPCYMDCFQYAVKYNILHGTDGSEVLFFHVSTELLVIIVLII